MGKKETSKKEMSNAKKLKFLKKHLRKITTSENLLIPSLTEDSKEYYVIMSSFDEGMMLNKTVKIEGNIARFAIDFLKLVKEQANKGSTELLKALAQAVDVMELLEK
jgi:Zn-dependent M32 family carboxypeptidase